MSSCAKTGFPTERSAKKGAAAVAKLNGHGMKIYRCDKCSSWHLTSDHNQILPWKRIRYWHFEAQATDGKYSVLRDRTTKEWYAYLPNGRKAGPFDGLGSARQWVDALTFLPVTKWDAEIKRVST